MEKSKTRKRLLRILDIAPALKEALLSTSSIDAQREKFRDFLSSLFEKTHDDETLSPLEWILVRDAIRVLLTILSPRSERLVGFSFLQYLNDLLYKESYRDIPKPTPDFFAELEHLLKGLMGKSGIYPEKVPRFAMHEGEKAARLRSADLSRMSAGAEKLINRYPCGLDSPVIRRRSTNQSRILKFFDATDQEWNDWKWHTRHIIRNAETLKSLVKITQEEYEAVVLARENRIPFGITPYYLSLMDYQPDRKNDYAVRAQVIPPLHYVKKMIEMRDKNETSMDFMLERNTSPIEGITRRYPMIVILKPVLTCPQICVYCQRNWEIEDVYSANAALPKEKLDAAIHWIADRPEIREVLVTGGDPLLLSNNRIEYILRKLSRMDHVERIRIGTRTPVTLPQRITDSLLRVISRFHAPGKREILIVTHFEHTYEITPQCTNAVQKFVRNGIRVYNQLVYTRYNSRKFEAAALRLKLCLIGVTPYYTFNTKGKEETDDYRVPIVRLLQEQHEEARLLPGSARTDEIVFNVPGLGKNYLRAAQNRDVISIFPDGRRAYEFHPWEKKLQLADTYVYTDVSIYQYLQRLKAMGEDTSLYRTIWYYY
ncbi:MAG: KamA family radical SAM protein [Deltaproteobacteria bacterium]|nr:KamA family radical SAM protein [Deltaproteobacteria bacterium]